MKDVDEWLAWLSHFSPLLTNEDLQGAVKYAVAAITILVSIVTLALKLRERHLQVFPSFAVTSTSWDARTKFPLLDVPFKAAPFPFVAADISTREPGPRGWYTVTELRIWNSGERPIWGAATSPNVDAHIAIDGNVGGYELRACLTNDATLKVNLGRGRHTLDGLTKVPIYFDRLDPGKGILVQIWNNSPSGTGIRLFAMSERATKTVEGVHHIINPSIVNFMNSVTLWLVVPVSVLAAFLLIMERFVPAAVAGSFAWLMIWSTYLYFKLKPLSPADLGFRNKNAKVLFNYGPG